MRRSETLQFRLKHIGEGWGAVTVSTMKYDSKVTIPLNIYAPSTSKPCMNSQPCARYKKISNEKVTFQHNLNNATAFTSTIPPTAAEADDGAKAGGTERVYTSTLHERTR